jgi:hypothetical protein
MEVAASARAIEVAAPDLPIDVLTSDRPMEEVALPRPAACGCEISTLRCTALLLLDTRGTF